MPRHLGRQMFILLLVLLETTEIDMSCELNNPLLRLTRLRSHGQEHEPPLQPLGAATTALLINVVNPRLPGQSRVLHGHAITVKVAI